MNSLGTLFAITTLAGLGISCGGDECTDFVGDCIGTGISVTMVDQNGAPFRVDSVTYTSTTGKSGEVCENPDGCSAVWIPIEVEDATFTVIVTEGTDALTDTVKIDAEQAKDVACCGPTLREEMTFEFTS